MDLADFILMGTIGNEHLYRGMGLGTFILRCKIVTKLLALLLILTMTGENLVRDLIGVWGGRNRGKSRVVVLFLSESLGLMSAFKNPSRCYNCLLTAHPRYRKLSNEYLIEILFSNYHQLVRTSVRSPFTRSVGTYPGRLTTVLCRVGELVTRRGCPKLNLIEIFIRQCNPR